MGSYTIISDIGNLMTGLLRENMVPDMIVNGDAIGLCSPAEKENISLGLYLYDVRESSDVRISGMQASGISRQKFPPMYLDLYYMLTAYSMSDSKFRAAEEQRMLGRAIQLFRDHPSIALESMSFGAAAGGEAAKIEMLSIEPSEKMKLWNNPNSGYRLSVFYKVSPVPVESERSTEIHRVTQIDMSVEEYGPNGR